MNHSLHAAWVVYGKELRDALRDRRTLLVVLLSSVAMGPLVLVLLSGLVANLEQRAEARELLVQGATHAPSLGNYLQRQGFTLDEAPGDAAERLKRNQLAEPVLVVPPGFEAALVAGERPRLRVLTHSANPQVQTGANRLQALLRGFNQEQATLRLALRGVAPAVLEAVAVDEQDLAGPAARAAQLAFMLPFFVLMAVVYGAQNAALDSTAGERERGSLEPLMMNPATPLALTLGKWAAVATLAMLIAVLGCFSFLPGQWLLRSESLAAMFRFGPHEALAFLALLLPLAGALAALLMAVAIRCKTVKEAQAHATVLVLLVTLLPVASVFQSGGESPWQLWVPALAQVTLMGRVLKGEALAAPDVLLPLLVCALLAGAGLWSVARRLRSAAVR